MHRTRKRFATTIFAGAAAASAALAVSAGASAQPAAPAPAPSLPGLPFIQQLATNPAAASQLMQGFTSLLGNAQAPAAPAATPPGATASITLPQTSTPPGMPGAAAPVNTPAAAPGSGLPNPLSSITSLMPEGMGLGSLLPAATNAAIPSAPGPAAAAPAAPPASVAPLLIPLSALP